MAQTKARAGFGSQGIYIHATSQLTQPTPSNGQPTLFPWCPYVLMVPNTFPGFLCPGCKVLGPVSGPMGLTHICAIIRPERGLAGPKSLFMSSIKHYNPLALGSHHFDNPLLGAFRVCIRAPPYLSPRSLYSPPKSSPFSLRKTVPPALPFSDVWV